MVDIFRGRAPQLFDPRRCSSRDVEVSLRHTEDTRAGRRTRPIARCVARGEVRVITPRSRGEHIKCASVGKHRNCSHARLH
eukprot:753485-Prymnesium_polylepis.1